MSGKGDKRRQEDAEAIRERWPHVEPFEANKAHRAHSRRLRGKDKDAILGEDERHPKPAQKKVENK